MLAVGLWVVFKYAGYLCFVSIDPELIEDDQIKQNGSCTAHQPTQVDEDVSGGSIGDQDGGEVGRVSGDADDDKQETQALTLSDSILEDLG